MPNPSRPCTLRTHMNMHNGVKGSLVLAYNLDVLSNPQELYVSLCMRIPRVW